MRCRGNPRADESRNQKQVIVVHPDGHRTRCVRQRGLGEMTVYPLVRAPGLLCEQRTLGHAVKERPQGTICEAVIVVFDLRCGQIDGHDIVRIRSIGRYRIALAQASARPANPCASMAAKNRVERRDDSARGWPALQPASAVHESERQAVGHHEKRRPTFIVAGGGSFHDREATTSRRRGASPHISKIVRRCSAHLTPPPNVVTMTTWRATWSAHAN